MSEQVGAAAAETPPDTSSLSYERARDELVEIVRRLEAGGTTLEEALALWERGEALAGVCQQWLDGARARLIAATRPPEAPEGRESGEGGDGREGNGSEAAGR